MPTFLTFSPRRKHVVLVSCIAAGMVGQGNAFAAGPESIPSSAVSAGDARALNGYGEILRPATRKKVNAVVQPYMPIKQQEDHGHIPEIEMFVGESRVFPAPNVGRIAVGNGQIMTAAALDRKEVIVFANGAGTSSLFVWNGDGRYQRIKVNIVAGDTSRVAREVATFLGAIPNAKTSIVGDKVIVEGDGLADADMLKIEQLEKRYPQIVNFTNKVGWEQMVFMDVKVVEFPRSELKEIGLKWGAVGGTTFGAIWSPVHAGRLPPNAQYQVNIPSGKDGLPITSPNGTTGGGAILPTSLNLISGLNLGLNTQLNLLEQQGRASVLAEPQLSARNGAKASFLAGGEFPYSVSNVNGVTIIFKPYGIKLDITPRVDRNGVVRATVQSEVSSIDASVTAVGGPALLTRRTETEFNVQAGETIVLSGLLQRNASTDIDKVPLLGDVPVLGALFRSKRFQNKETELVVFVTPSIVDSRSPGLVDRVSRTTSRLAEQMGPQPYLSDPLQPGRPAAEVNRAPAQEVVPPPRTTPVLPEAGPAAVPVPAAPSASAPVLPLTAAPALPLATAPAMMRNGNQNLKAVVARARAGTASASTMTATVAPAAVSPVAPLITPASAAADDARRLQVTSRMATLRAEPSRSAVAVQYLPKGASVRRDDRAAPPSGLWRSVTVGAVQGWILASAVGSVNRADTAPAPAPGAGAFAGASVPSTILAKAVSAAPGAGQYRVIVDGLALRTAPDVNAQTITHLAAGKIVGASPQATKGLWTAVQSDGQHGWVATQWLIIDQPLAQR